MDKGEFDMDAVYRFDPVEFSRRVMQFKDIQIGTVIGLLHEKDWPWAKCFAYVRRQNWNSEDVMARCPWLRPEPLKAADVSLLLKHRLAWEKIAASSHDYAIVAEDDLVLFEHSIDHLEVILDTLPADFDYVDIAGGLNLFPRRGDPVFNTHFYRMIPPRERTTCCAILRKRLVEKLLRDAPSFMLGIDWVLTPFFQEVGANVYWVEPVVFGHGTQMNVYKSNREVDT